MLFVYLCFRLHTFSAIKATPELAEQAELPVLPELAAQAELPALVPRFWA